MDWSDLQVFLEACRSGSATRAAGALDVSVSTVTRRLAELERVVGKPLFERLPTGLVLTPVGELLRAHAERAERAILEGASAVASVGLEVEGEVVVAVPNDMLLLILLPRLRPFLDAHPSLTVVFDDHPTVADLSRREADIAVRIRVPDQGEELITSRLRTVHLALFCRRDVLAAMDDPSDPRSHRWLTWDQAGTPGRAWMDAISGGVYGMRCSSAVTARHAIAAGLGTGLLPRSFGEVTPDLAEVPIPVDMSFELQLITHRAIRSRPAVGAMWEELERLLRPQSADIERALLRESLRVYGW
jgi:DNA-binding transcriptional LysR family regulator